MSLGLHSRDTGLDAALRAAEECLVRGDIADALRLTMQASRQAPDDARVLRLLGASLGRHGRHDEAIAALERALVHAPDDALVHNSLGACLLARGERERAITAFRRAGELAPDLVQSRQNLSLLLFAEQRVEEALAAVDEVLARAPHLAGVRVHRGAMLLSLGRIDEAIGEYRRAGEENPNIVGSWLGLGGIKHYRFSDREAERLHVLHDDERLGERDRAALAFVLARILDDRGAYAEAHATLDRANAAVRACVPWSAEAASAEVDAILAAFPARVTSSAGERGAETIFIVSLPRSGSTLVEQILASHPQIHGAGELGDLERLIEAEGARRGVAFATWAEVASDADWQRLGDTYLLATARWRAQRPFVADKLPGNWRYVGAIRRMLPGARIVVCRRDPLETALSCYRQHFGGDGQAWSYDVASIAAYWHDFERATRRWQALHPASVHVVQYEKLVDDPRREIGALLDFCRLPFDPSCLEFHKTRRAVSTMSASQVREPLRRDTARADRYGTLLEPLRSALAAVSAD